MAGQLRPVGQGDGDEVIDRAIERQERHPEVRGFEGFHEDRGVEAQEPHEVGARRAPALPRRAHGLAASGQLRPRPRDFHREHQPLGQALRPAHEVLGPQPGVLRADQFAPGLLDVEVCHRDRQERVVRGSLDAGLPGAHDLARGQGREDRVGDGEDGIGAGAEHHRTPAGTDHIPLGGLDPPIMP